MGRVAAASPTAPAEGPRRRSPQGAGGRGQGAGGRGKGAERSVGGSRLPAPVLTGEPVLGFSSKESTGKGPVGIGVS
jgi:hypothetical protein